MTWMTLPNAVTMVRLAALPFAYAALAGDRTHALLALLAVIALSDFLDGALARALHAQSDTGKMLDPLVDKICALVLAVGAAVYRPVPMWAVAMVFAKDIFVAAGATLIAGKKRVPITPNFWGKACLLSEFWAFSAYALHLDRFQRDSLAIMAFFIVVSTAIYAAIFARVMRGRKTVEEIVAGYTAYGLSGASTPAARRTNALIYVVCAAVAARLIWVLLE